MMYKKLLFLLLLIPLFFLNAKADVKNITMSPIGIFSFRNGSLITAKYSPFTYFTYNNYDYFYDENITFSSMAEYDMSMFNFHNLEYYGLKDGFYNITFNLTGLYDEYNSHGNYSYINYVDIRLNSKTKRCSIQHVDIRLGGNGIMFGNIVQVHCKNVEYKLGGNTSPSSSDYFVRVQNYPQMGISAISDSFEFTWETNFNAVVNEQKATNNILNDDNVDGANNKASEIFGRENNSHGLSGIITAPLQAINKMLDGSCSPLTATYKGKTISLYCGTNFWNSLGGIKTFYNLVVGGILSYSIVRKLFLIIQNLKNPEDDRVEVMKL